MVRTQRKETQCYTNITQHDTITAMCSTIRQQQVAPSLAQQQSGSPPPSWLKLFISLQSDCGGCFSLLWTMNLAVFFLTCVWVVGGEGVRSTCPALCRCEGVGMLQNVDCVETGLKSVPSDLSCFTSSLWVTLLHFSSTLSSSLSGCFSDPLLILYWSFIDQVSLWQMYWWFLTF